MATDPTATRDFPAALHDVPPAARVRETFGWMPALVGGVLLGQPLFFLDSPPDAVVGGSVALALLGVLLIGFEAWRRRNRTVLVPRGATIGVYRKRAFVGVIGAGDIVPYRLSWTNTFQYLALPVTMTGVLLYIGVMPPSQRYVPMEERLAWLGAGLLAAAASASLVRTRVMCLHFIIPKGRGRETILLPRAEASRLTRG